MLSAMITAVATAISALLTVFIVLHNKHIMDLSFRPEIQICVKCDDVNSNIINLKVENTGKVIAKNIKFRIQGDGPVFDYLKTTGLFVDGLNYLGVGEKVLLPTVGILFDQKTFNSYLLIMIDYQNQKNKKYQEEFNIDFKYLRNVYCNRAAFEDKMLKVMRTIQKSQKDISKSFRELVLIMKKDRGSFEKIEVAE